MWGINGMIFQSAWHSAWYKIEVQQTIRFSPQPIHLYIIEFLEELLPVNLEQLYIQFLSVKLLYSINYNQPL